MENQNIFFSPVSLDTLKSEFKQIIDAAILSIKPKEEKFLNSKETCNLFEPPISKPTLINWEKSGKIPSYRIGRRVYYKLSEVLDAAKTLKKYGRAYNA